MQAARRLFAALACAAACHAAYADRSKLDEDDGVEAGDCELDLQSERQSTGGEPRQRESAIELGCGIGLRTELVATLARQRGGGVRDEAIAIEANTWLGRWGPGGLGWELAYGASRERAGGGRWRHSESFVAIEAAFQPHEGWAVDARLGTVRDTIERRDTTVWELGLEHELAETLEVRAELVGDDRQPRPLAGVELRYEFWPDRARLNLSYGARRGPAHERRVGVGITFEF